jgi:hypothetical protein
MLATAIFVAAEDEPPAVLAGTADFTYSFPKGAGQGETIDMEIFGVSVSGLQDVLFYHPGITCEEIVTKPRNNSAGVKVSKNKRVVEIANPGGKRLVTNFTIRMRGADKQLQFAELEVISGGVNIVKDAAISQSPRDDKFPTNNVIDGDKSTFITAKAAKDPYLAVRFKKPMPVDLVRIHTRSGAENRFHGAEVRFFNGKSEIAEHRVPIVKPLALYRRYDQKMVKWDPNRYAVARIKVAPDCPPGEHQMRLRTRAGLSQLRTFWVGTFPSVAEFDSYGADNKHWAFSQHVPMNCTVNGRLSYFDIDKYRVKLKKGQRFTAELEAERLSTYENSNETDLMVSLIDKKGNVLAESMSTDLFLADPVLSLIVPQDGEYAVEVKQAFVLAGGARRVYRLHIGDFVRPMALYPPGGTAGASVDCTVIGGPQDGATARIKSAAKTGDIGAYPQVNGSTAPPTPNPFRVSKALNTLELEPNDTHETATVAADYGVPVALNGIINKPGDKDVFRFTVPGGLKNGVRIRLFGQAIGSPIDGKFTVYRIGYNKTKNVEFMQQQWAKNDSNAAALDFVRIDNRIRHLLDPVHVISPSSQDVDYAVSVTDAHGRGGPAFVYRVEVEEIEPHVMTYFPTYGNQHYRQQRNRVCLSAGNRVAMRLALRPLNGSKIKADMRVRAIGLPDGVTMSAPIAPAGTTQVPIVFTAENTVKPQQLTFDIVAEPVDPSVSFTSGFRQVAGFYQRNNGYCRTHTFVNKAAMSIMEPAPFSVDIEPVQTALLKNGQIELKVKVNRAEDFDNELRMDMDWVPANISRRNAMVIEEGASEGLFAVSASSNADPGDYQVALSVSYRGEKANDRTGEQIFYSGTELVNFTVGEPYMKATVPRSSVERGKVGELSVKVEHLREFKGRAQATLKGLPRGVELQEEWVDVGLDTKQIVFKLNATPDALYGMKRGVYCTFRFDQGKKTFQQNSGWGHLRVDPERVASVAKGGK